MIKKTFQQGTVRQQHQQNTFFTMSMMSFTSSKAEKRTNLSNKNSHSFYEPILFFLWIRFVLVLLYVYFCFIALVYTSVNEKCWGILVFGWRVTFFTFKLYIFAVFNTVLDVVLMISIIIISSINGNPWSESLFPPPTSTQRLEAGLDHHCKRPKVAPMRETF